MSESRSALIEKIVSVAFDAAHGIKNVDEQNLMQILGELVKSKLMSADDSFTLRERLLDTERFDKYIGERVEHVVRRKQAQVH